jgi:hypothetical protein
MPGWTFWGLELVSVLCALHLWARAPGSAAKKVVWTFLVLVPVLGPLFYGAIYDAPGEQEEGLQAAESNLDAEGD